MCFLFFLKQKVLLIALSLAQVVPNQAKNTLQKNKQEEQR